MATYKIVSHAGEGLPLNVSTSGIISGRTNVNIYTDTGSYDQRWSISMFGSNRQVKSMNNLSYMLNANTLSWNCDVYTANSDAYVNFIFVRSGVYRIQLSSDDTKYLTAIGATSGSNVGWAEETGTSNQEWKISIIASAGSSATVAATVCTASSGTQLTTAQRESNAKYIYDFLLDEGFNKIAACAVLGNIEQESGFNPGIWESLNNTNKGYGIVQWTPATTFLNRAVETDFLDSATYTAANDLAESNAKTLMLTELRCLIWCCSSRGDYGNPSKFGFENHTGYTLSFPDFKKATYDVGTMAIIFHDHYERSGDNETMLNVRAANAEKWYNYF